jgi:RNA-binding motif X-linked protein 2
MNTIREIQKINEQELERGLAGTPVSDVLKHSFAELRMFALANESHLSFLYSQASWHQKYLQSAWVYVGNFDQTLTEGDVLCVMSQYGEVDDVNLVRDETTGKSKGFCFLKYEDARSCVVAVDNLGGADVCGRPLRVDHVEKYRLPKHLQEKEDAIQQSTGAGHAYVGEDLQNEYSLHRGQDLFAPADTRIMSDLNEERAKESKRQRKASKRRHSDDRDERKREKKMRKGDREERRGHKRSKIH